VYFFTIFRVSDLIGGLINDISSCADVVKAIVADAEEVIKTRLVTTLEAV